MGTVQDRFDPRQAPLHERNFKPFAGLAVSVTGEYEGNVAEHRGRHVIPDRELCTAPCPETRTVRRKAAGAKSADTLEPDPTVTVQPAGPTQAVPQRTSFAPGFGVAVSASRMPEFHVVLQLWAQCRPGTSADTDPGPEIETANGVWLSCRTSQGESWASGHAPEWP